MLSKMVIMPAHRANQHVSAKVTIAQTNLEDSIDEDMEMSGSRVLCTTDEEKEKNSQNRTCITI